MTNQRFEAATSVIISKLREMTAEQRVQFFDTVLESYCKNCGERLSENEKLGREVLERCCPKCWRLT